jgi:hypothetical protein
MKMAIGSLTLALALIVTPAAAEPLYVLPPMEYDHPYGGELTIHLAKDQAEVRATCPNSKFPPIGALGCALLHPNGKQCWIVLAPDADIVAVGHTTEIVKRHEIGHCNGWPADHAGARSIDEWAEAVAKPEHTAPHSPLTSGDSAVDRLLFGR